MSAGRMPAPFPGAAVLLSRAWVFCWGNPSAALGLGLAGSVPFAAVLLLYLQESAVELLLRGSTAEALRPLAFGLAGVYLVRYPFRMALARWMALALRGERASVGGSAAWALLHLPAALLYGSACCLGWVWGLCLGVPLLALFQGSLAFHRFASETDETAWRSLAASSKVPAGRVGVRLLSVCAFLWAIGFVLLWISPGAALGLAEWLLRAEVGEIRSLLGPTSAPWIAVSVVVPLSALEVLWAVAFGLLNAEWQSLSRGADLRSALRELERAPAGGTA